MAARVIHVGADTCHRLPVLEHAGYSVRQCGTMAELAEALDMEESLEAVLLSESEAPEEAISLAHDHSTAPLVLFRETQRNVQESTFDLVVPNLDPPEDWLTNLAAVIAKAEVIRARSIVLRQEAAALTARSKRERERSKLESSRNRSLIDGFARQSDPPRKP